MSDCCSAPGLLPFEDALQQLLDTVSVVSEFEEIPIENALGRVVASDVASLINVPPHNNSAMDGYAFNFDQVNDDLTFVQVGKSFAGSPYHGELNPGECIRIMTGAKLPDCCDTVVMQENTKVDDGKVVLTKEPSPKSHVRYIGEDIKTGESILEKGHLISPIDIGLLASLGVSKVNVFRKLKVAIISTGDELKLPGQDLSEGDIYESNGFVLTAMLRRLDVDILEFGILPDVKEDIRAAFERANTEADVVISSGGVSVGEADYTKEVLDELGHIDFWKIAIKPGKPFAFGQLSDSVFFGLPGNPVSAAVTFHQLAVPGINKMQGQVAPEQARLQVKTVDPLRKSAGRMDFQRGILFNNESGELLVRSTGAQGSGILSSLAKANCYIVLATEQGKVDAGSSVQVLPFDQLMS